MKEIVAQRNICAGQIELYFFSRTNGGKLLVAEPILLKEITEEGISFLPVTSINQTEAQVLMDSLWDCGIRPTEGSGSAGAMAAVQKHLEDMRTIAFRGLGMEKGK
jgi:hypothetical protein